MQRIPESLNFLFWEYEPNTIDVKKHSNIIMARIIERGTWDAMKWLRKTYSKEDIIKFIAQKGVKFIPPRELNYWLLICDAEEDLKRDIIKTAKQNISWNGYVY